MKTTYFVLHLLTIQDIMVGDVQANRVIFHDPETCIYVAQSLHQMRDPITRKLNCVAVEDFQVELRIPLPKPEFMK